MVLNIINIIALIIIPIFAVLIGQWLQSRSEKRKDKMRVFTHLMSYRAFGYVDQYSVNIFNSVPIVFYNNKEVIEKYNIYLKSLNIKQEDIEQKKKEIEDNQTNMLVAMAKSLKYKKINWERIQNPYIPTGLLKNIEQENMYKKGQLGMAKLFTQMTDDATPIEAVRQYSAEIESKLRKQKATKANKKDEQ